MVQRHPASFKDPSGFVFHSGGTIYRQVNNRYAAAYDQFMSSGVYAQLVKEHLLIPHAEVNDYNTEFPNAYKILLPEQIPVISYPAEWCFNQLQDAALATLRIAETAMQQNMMLKDATPYNIQFVKGKPVWIDTLSFDVYDETQPWVAYRQFCETMLYPLMLAHYRGLELRELFGAWPDGIPATVIAGLLPFKTKFTMGTALHVHLPASAYSKQKTNEQKKVAFSRGKMTRMLQHLTSVVSKLKKGKRRSVWADYYEDTILSKQYLSDKEQQCEKILSGIAFETVIDAGCNDGNFTKLLSKQAKHILSADTDEQVIINLYQYIKQHRVENILPVVADLANPTAASGVLNTERRSFLQRSTADLVLALALVHHLAIGRFMQFAQIAETLSGMGNYLLVEFVPPQDDRAQQLLAGRDELFSHYTEEEFIKAFEVHYKILSVTKVAASERKLFLMEKR